MSSAAVVAMAAVFATVGAAHERLVSRTAGHRSPAGLPQLSAERTFDSISLPRTAEFWNKWHLVTVRFRKDIDEQRFVYANDLAWNAIRENKGLYPDGAMFGKVAFSATDDPSFPNSAEPRHFSRLQLMKKDSRAYSRTDGWGYAILVGGHAPPYDSVASTVTACHACHRLVPERDFVFSKATFLGAAFTPSLYQAVVFRKRFARIDRSSLTAFQREALGRLSPTPGIKPIEAIYSLDMDLFEGSVNENVGVLSGFATHDTTVFAIWDHPHRRYVIAKPLPPVASCDQRVAILMTDGGPLSSGSTAASGSRPTARTRISVTCAAQSPSAPR